MEVERVEDKGFRKRIVSGWGVNEYWFRQVEFKMPTQQLCIPDKYAATISFSTVTTVYQEIT